MSRTMAIFAAIGLTSLLIAGRGLAQVFAQAAVAAEATQAAAGEAPRPVDPAPPAVGVAQGSARLAAPPPAGGSGFIHVGGPAATAAPGVPATPRLPAPVPAPPQAGGFIRAVGPGGAGNFVFQSGPGWSGDMAGFGLGAPGHDDPEMSKLMQTEHELARQSDDLVRQYSETEDYSQREKLRGQLRELLVKQFEAQQQRRERELSNVETRLGKLREQLKKRTSARDTIVDRRLENLTSDAEGLGWTAPSGGGPQGLTVFGGQPPRPRPAVAR